MLTVTIEMPAGKAAVDLFQELQSRLGAGRIRLSNPKPVGALLLSTVEVRIEDGFCSGPHALVIIAEECEKYLPANMR